MSELELDHRAITMNRGTFLRRSLQLFAASSIVVGGGSTLRCRAGGPLPELRGISEQEYHNMNALGEVFLGELPFDLDLGKATDDYIYGHPSPIDVKENVHELAGVPSSWLAALLLDASFTTLVSLESADRRLRLLGWRDSDSVMKRGLFNIMKQTCFFLMSSSKEYVAMTGYKIDDGFVPYRYVAPV